MPKDIFKEQADKELFLRFLAGLYLCDHMGDLADDIEDLLEGLGIEIDYHDFTDLSKEIALQFQVNQNLRIDNLWTEEELKEYQEEKQARL